HRSAKSLDLTLAQSLDEIRDIQRELIRRNAIDQGLIYLQASRGAADRNFTFTRAIAPTFFAFTQRKLLVNTPAQQDGVRVAIQPDPRWTRRDIKTTMLLGQVLAKRQALEGGFDDVWFVEQGRITEGASSTAYIV